MPLGKCVLVETNNTTEHTYYPLNAVVKWEGNKRPDTLSASFPMTDRVKENYSIRYIEDVVDVTYLKAVYPMQLSCKDEAGQDVDPATDPVEARFVNVTTDKFKGHYALEFDADGEGIIFTDPRSEINISKQFDIHIWFTPDTTQLVDLSDEPILWAFRGSGNNRGLEIGITGTNGDDPSWRVFLRINNGSVTNGFTGSSETIMNGAEVPVHIRVKRGQDNLVKAYVNGIEDISTSVTQDLQPAVATDMIFGDSEASTNDEYSGLIHEIKIYNGTDLTENQAERIRWVKPIAQYMKFAGRVVKMKNSQDARKATCQSNSYQLTKAKLGKTGSSLDTHELASIAFDVILQSAVDEIDTSFTVRHLDAFAEVTEVFALAGTIFEVGNFINFANILLLYSDTILYITPRKNIIIETNAGKATDYVFDQNGANVKYNIKNAEDNDLKLVNEVIFTGRSPAAAQRSNITPTSGIIRTLRANIEPIDNSNDLNELAVKTRLDQQGDVINDLANTKYRIEVTSPLPHVRYNQTVDVIRKNGANAAELTGLDFDLDATASGDGQLFVRQIETYYPNGSTVIKVGENDIDYFDDIVVGTRVEEGLTDTTL